MTKKTLQLLATAAIVAGFGFTTVTANAASTSSDTVATVNLTPGDTTTGAGGIKLLSAPDVSFSGQLNGDKQTFTDGVFTTNASSEDTKASAGTVTVNDPGTASGWNVQVASTPFVGATTKGSLNASQMIFGTPAVSPKDSTQTGAPTPGTALTFAADEKNDNLLVFKAAAGEGVGTWMANYAAKDASFVVAAGNKADTYTSNLTWTLTNTPA